MTYGLHVAQIDLALEGREGTGGREGDRRKGGAVPGWLHAPYLLTLFTGLLGSIRHHDMIANPALAQLAGGTDQRFA